MKGRSSEQLREVRQTNERALTTFRNNEFRASSSGESTATVNPATGQEIISVSHSTKDDVDEAVRAARKAFKTTWGNNLPSAERGACECTFCLLLAKSEAQSSVLNKLADLMERDIETISALER